MSTTSDARYRRDLAEDARREAAHRARCKRAVAVETLLAVALDRERDLPPAEQMPLAALDRLVEMLGEVSDAIRRGSELSEQAMGEAVAFLHEHVKDPQALAVEFAKAITK